MINYFSKSLLSFCVYVQVSILLLLLSPLNTLAEDTGPDNLVFDMPVTASGTEGNPNVLIDGVLLEEGTKWKHPKALVFPNHRTSVQIDLQAERRIEALVIQADNNDRYFVEGSLNNSEWVLLWRVLRQEKTKGLRTRYTVLSEPARARYLRVRPGNGDGAFSVSELRAYSKVPRKWPPIAVVPSDKDDYFGCLPFLDQKRVDIIKTATAVIGLMILVWGAALRYAGGPSTQRKGFDRALLAVGLFSFICWFNLLQGHFTNYTHDWDSYHYYIGGKYFPELGYTRIYHCGVIADLEDGVIDQNTSRTYRNLLTNIIEPAKLVLAKPEECKKHFSEKRWQSFRHDIKWYRDFMGVGRWNKSQIDHGFNGTPAWAVLGYLLSNTGPASLTRVVALVSIDSVLLVIMWLMVWWAFGWRAMCVAMIYWGTNYPARFWWTGASFLRQDWLFCAVAGVCLLKKDMHFLAGASLMYSTLMRIFPGAILVGIALKAAMNCIRLRKITLSPEHQSFLGGSLLVFLVMFTASTLVAGRPDVWHDFYKNSAKHLDTPLTNNMGLKTLLSFDYTKRAEEAVDYYYEDPFLKWKEEQKNTFHSRLPIFALLVFAYIVLLARIVSKEEDWVAAALAVGLVPLATTLTCYYYSILLLFGLLWIRRESIGVSLVAFAWTTYLMDRVWNIYDELFTAMSLASVILVAAVTLLMRKTKNA